VDSINYLIELSLKNKNLPVVKQMKLIVAEYKSKNSVYEKLDMVDKSEMASGQKFNETEFKTMLQ
jgi:hypothetical protein